MTEIRHPETLQLDSAAIRLFALELITEFRHDSLTADEVHKVAQTYAEWIEHGDGSRVNGYRDDRGNQKLQLQQRDDARTTDACGWCELLPAVNGWVRTTQDRCPVHGTNPDPPASPAAPREVVLPRQAIFAIEAAAHECFVRWESTPNRDAYVWVEMERAARAAVHAVAADLMDVAAMRERARIVDYLREHIGHMSARDIERGDHWTDSRTAHERAGYTEAS